MYFFEKPLAFSLSLSLSLSLILNTALLAWETYFKGLVHFTQK